DQRRRGGGRRAATGASVRRLAAGDHGHRARGRRRRTEVGIAAVSTDAGGRDVGAASIWVLACCALLMLMAAVVTVCGLAVLARHRAEAGADLAALAAAERIGVSD